MSFERMFECLSEEFLAVGLSINFIQMGDRVTPVYITPPQKRKISLPLKDAIFSLFTRFFAL